MNSIKKYNNTNKMSGNHVCGVSLAHGDTAKLVLPILFILQKKLFK